MLRQLVFLLQLEMKNIFFFLQVEVYLGENMAVIRLLSFKREQSESANLLFLRSAGTGNCTNIGNITFNKRVKKYILEKSTACSKKKKKRTP